MKLIHVVGARPNFMKVAPVWSAIGQDSACHQFLVHTGQHYDVKMSDVFFTELNLPVPNFYLGVGSGSHAQQTAAVMTSFEKVVQEVSPDITVVYGDVNSTLAATLVSAKLGIPVAHVEAGLRSFDRTMPEELNRIVTDQLASLLFTPSSDGDENLLREGIAPEKIHQVGNVMIDTLVRLLPQIEQAPILTQLGVEPRSYAVLTLHRPANVDDDQTLRSLMTTVSALSEQLPIVFPIHPRTRQRLKALDLSLAASQIQLIEPLGYLDFLRLVSQAQVVITDSGGVQEETTYLGIPCLTMRSNTERPITVTLGTNQLIGSDSNLLMSEFEIIVKRATAGDRLLPFIPLWDGHAAERIAKILRTEHLLTRSAREISV